MVKLKSKFDQIQNMQVKYWGIVTQKLMPTIFPNSDKAIHSLNGHING